jgi:hypothetical protein
MDLKTLHPAFSVCLILKLEQKTISKQVAQKTRAS